MKHINEQNRFFEAYEDFSDGLFRYCLLRVYERERAKDIVQDAFMKTWEYAAKGGEIVNMKSFLYRTARNLIIDQSRRKKALSLDELMEQGLDPSGKENNFTASIDAVTSLESLEPLYRDVLILRYINGLSVKEIAEIIGEKENTVSVRIKRALEKARNFFDDVI